MADTGGEPRPTDDGEPTDLPAGLDDQPPPPKVDAPGLGGVAVSTRAITTTVAGAAAWASLRALMRRRSRKKQRDIPLAAELAAGTAGTRVPADAETAAPSGNGHPPGEAADRVAERRAAALAGGAP